MSKCVFDYEWTEQKQNPVTGTCKVIEVEVAQLEVAYSETNVLKPMKLDYDGWEICKKNKRMPLLSITCRYMLKAHRYMTQYSIHI